MVIVDTTVWIDYFQGVENPETEWLNTEIDRQRDDVVAKEVERRLLNLEVFDTGGVAVAREAARNYRALRSRGHTVRKTIDCLIATFCLRGQHSLLHRDRDFDPFEKFLELSVIHP